MQTKVKQFINLSSGSIYNPYNGELLETDLIRPNTFMNTQNIYRRYWLINTLIF